jgi:hypothetical protein
MKVLSDKQVRRKNDNRKYRDSANGKKVTHICQWKNKGLIDDYDKVYDRYDKAPCCELCGVIFSSEVRKNMEHSHVTKLFRNVVCTKCNLNKSDVKISANNKTGYKHISKLGGGWIFTKNFHGKIYRRYRVDKIKILCIKFAYILLHKY